MAGFIPRDPLCLSLLVESHQTHCTKWELFPLILMQKKAEDEKKNKVREREREGERESERERCSEREGES